jgi:tripartite-type tricarboxylate transporter receptor subunit TctC
MRKKICVLFFMMLPLLAIPVHSEGQEYPTKSIELYSAYTPGSSFDLTARVIAEFASKYLGQPVIVVNKPGAGGSIAAADLVGSKPDGYKFMLISNNFFAITVKTQKITFDPNHLIPIASLIVTKNAFFVKGDSPWKTLNDLLEYGKKNPGKLRWAHAGRGTILHFAPLLMFKKAGVESIEIPYKGTPELVSAILGGHIDAASGTYAALKDNVKAGKIRILTFYSDRRFSEPSDVPCATELGYQEVGRFTTFGGLYIHKDTPPAALKTLFNALKKTFEDPGFKKGIENLGEEVRFEGPEFNKEAIKKAEEIAIPLLKDLGIYVER